MEKMVVVAPMPKASISTAVAVNPLDLRNCRKTSFRSERILMHETPRNGLAVRRNPR